VGRERSAEGAAKANSRCRTQQVRANVRPERTHGPLAVNIGLVHRRATVRENPGAGRVAVDSGEVKRGLAEVGGGVDARAVAAQPLHRFRVPVVCRHVQRARARKIRNVHVRALGLRARNDGSGRKTGKRLCGLGQNMGRAGWAMQSRWNLTAMNTNKTANTTTRRAPFSPDW